MKFKLLFFSFLITSSFLKAQTNQDAEAKLKQVIEAFRVSIIEQDDFEKFSNLFLHDSITWAAIVTGKTKQMVLKQKPDFTFKSSTYKSFFNNLKKGSEEKFYDVNIDVRNDFATISFEYSFNVNSEIQNWGTEYWSLIKIHDSWKITSVIWSQNLSKLEKCPFTSENLFTLR